MATCFQFALSNPVSGQEEEFNRWYGTDHLIHSVLIPGILAGQRFRRVEGAWPSGKHDYLTIWEMDDPAFALAQLAQARGTDTMPISPSVDMSTVQPPTMWRRATVRTRRAHRDGHERAQDHRADARQRGSWRGRSVRRRAAAWRPRRAGGPAGT